MDHLFCERLVMVVLVFFTTRVPIAAVAVNAAFPALFAFGDSILDTGNNNNLPSLLKCNFPPYGRDFIGGIPTGRWCDGKVPSDLIAESLRIKQTLPAYLDRNLGVQDLPTGVCFASGGSGLDNLTSSTLGVISMSAQLQMFQEYIGRLTASVGQQQASNIISNSLYLLSAGNNDIAITYSSLRRPMLFPAYANLLVGWTQSFLKDLYGLGARHVWVLSTLPLGCLPGARLTAAGQCNELENGLAQQFNTMLSQGVNSIQASLPGFDVDFIDVDTPLRSIINNPLGSGFANAATPCCGTGTQLCNTLSQCPIPSTYVFWDIAHPTQRTYEIIVSQILQFHVPTNRLTAAGLCNELENGLAQQFNTMLSQGVNSIKASLPGFDVDFIDVDTPLRSIINNPLGSGFANAATQCCGTGALVCNIVSQCPIPSTHVFWDIAHPTQRTYEIIVSQILQVQRSKLSNSSFASSPLNLVSH